MISRKDDAVTRSEHPDPFTADEYANIESFQDAVDLVRETLGEKSVLKSSDLGDGFVLLSKASDKDLLIDVSFLVMHYRFISSDKVPNSEFVSMRVVTKQNHKYIVNDGSTGIYRQIRELDTKGHSGPIYAANGLRRSDYSNEYTNEGVTYYIDTSNTE